MRSIDRNIRDISRGNYLNRQCGNICKFVSRPSSNIFKILLCIDTDLIQRFLLSNNVFNIVVLFFFRTTNRFVTYDGAVECLRSLGVVQAAALLEALSFHHHPSKRICLRELIVALQEEMHAALDNGLLTNTGPSGAALHAGVLLMQHELSSVRYLRISLVNR